MIKRLLFMLSALGLLAACERTAPPSADPDQLPAIWQIASADGTVEGWLFGTIHALPDGVAWRSARLDRLLESADLLVVEVAGLEDGDQIAQAFTQLAFDTPGPPLEQRVTPDRRATYEELLTKARVRRDQFDAMESWAAALTLAQVAQGARTENGVDRALLADFGDGEVVELEGALAQLRIFDSLSETDQRELLNAIIDESESYRADMGRLSATWRSGDLKGIEELTSKGMLADPELYEALLAARNRRWAGQIENLLSAEARPFIAVGAGHVVGPDGLPAQLAALGFTVSRVQ